MGNGNIHYGSTIRFTKKSGRLGYMYMYRPLAPLSGIQNLWGSLRLFQGIYKDKTIFIIILRCHLPFSFSHEYMMAFSRRYIPCNTSTD